MVLVELALIKTIQVKLCKEIIIDKTTKMVGWGGVGGESLALQSIITHGVI